MGLQSSDSNNNTFATDKRTAAMQKWGKLLLEFRKVIGFALLR